jgi:uncharacterized membrane protein
MSNQPPYNNPQGGYPPPGGGYPGGGGYQGGGYPPPPPQGGAPGKTKVLNLDYNVAAMLCYLLAFCCCLHVVVSILWLATEPKESRFVRFHSIQALGLFAIGVVVWIISSILGLGMAFTPSDMMRAGGGLIFLVIRMGIGLIFLVVYILCAVKAYQGDMFKLPLLGDIAEKNS